MYPSQIIRGKGIMDLRNEQFVTRGALDVGTGGRITWTIASIYPHQAIMRKHIFHSSLHLPPTEVMIQANIITPNGIAALENAFFEIFGRLDEARMRPRQMAAIVSEPLSNTLNSSEVFSAISQRFLIAFKLADRGQMEHYAHLAYVTGAGLSLSLAPKAIVWTEIDDRVVFLRRNKIKICPDEEQMSSNIDTWDTKHTAGEVHKTILANYQNRKIVEAVRSDGSIQSVNPMSSQEIRIAVDDLTKAFRLTMPTWLKNARHGSGANDRLFCGASANGGTINILSRSCYKTDIDLYTARSHLYSTYTGVSDAFLARSFSKPHLVLPRLIIGHALMNALDLRYLRYLPETSPSYGILVSDEFFPASQPCPSGLTVNHQTVVYLEKPWKALSGNPHYSQHLQSASDALLFRNFKTKK